MISLQTALNANFPIELPRACFLGMHDQILHGQPTHVRGQRRQKRLNAGTIRIKLTPNPATFFATVYTLEAIICHRQVWKPLLTMWGCDQPALVIPGPGVIGTGKSMTAAAFGLDQTGATMSTYIVKGVDLALAITGQQNRHARNCATKKGTLTRQFADMSHQQWITTE